MASPTPVKTTTTNPDNIGFGKVILFGEHFVVYGAPAIVAGVSQYTDCQLTLRPAASHPPSKDPCTWTVIDNRPAIPGYITAKAEEQRLAHRLVLEHHKINTATDNKTLEIKLGGPLVPTSGIGASASDVVALSRALSEMYALKLTEDQVNQSAYMGEAGYHGTPSGVDNTAATFGGLISYRLCDDKTKMVNGKPGRRPEFAPVRFHTPLHLVVAGTGITASTSKVVGDVRAMKEKDPLTFKSIMEEYETVMKAATVALMNSDLTELGQLMNQNHALLHMLNVSCRELDAIVARCRALGALGAKLAGTGRGGIAVALCASAGERKALSAELKKTCPEAKFVWEYDVVPKELGQKASIPGATAKAQAGAKL